MKIKFRFLIMISIVLGAILIFGQNKVEAYERAIIIDGTPTANSLDNLPDTIELDIKESEIEKVPALVMEKVKPELEKQGITTIPEEYSADEQYTVNVWFGDVNDEWTSWDYIGDIYKVNVRITMGYGSLDNNHIINREIKIKYNNTQDYNEEDKMYVANFIEEFRKEYPEVYFYVKPKEDYNFIERLYNIINDPSIALVANGAIACDVEWAESGFLVFKDDVYYDWTKVESYTYYVTADVDIGNNIIVDGLLEDVTITVMPKENNSMRDEVIKLGYNEILGEYELTLVGADSLACPIDLTFDIGKIYSGMTACILHKKKDGTDEKFEQKIVDGKVKITVGELSPFVIGVKEPDYLLGDVDGNGKIDAQDAVMILKYVAHNIELDEKQLLAANTTKDEDGTVDATDAVQILKLVAHNISEF